ncbi:MAG TPA: DciA family protein [Caulobacteraceae bacterium]|nr:DciA family protein [Caulobacteraceae bacterium]
MRRPLPSPQEALAILARRPPRAAPRPIRHGARGLGKVMKQLEDRFGAGPDDLKARWREIVGEALAGRSEPVKLVKSRAAGATLELKVAGPVAALVQHQAPLILDRLNLFLGPGSVAKLRIVQGPLSKTAPAPARPTVVRRSRAPLDAAAEHELAEGLADAPDGPLKAALLRLGREVLRSQSR